MTLVCFPNLKYFNPAVFQVFKLPVDLDSRPAKKALLPEARSVSRAQATLINANALISGDREVSFTGDEKGKQVQMPDWKTLRFFVYINRVTFRALVDLFDSHPSIRLPNRRR